jgi:hypothetical protein
METCDINIFYTLPNINNSDTFINLCYLTFDSKDITKKLKYVYEYIKLLPSINEILCSAFTNIILTLDCNIIGIDVLINFKEEFLNLDLFKCTNLMDVILTEKKYTCLDLLFKFDNHYATKIVNRAFIKSAKKSMITISDIHYKWPFIKYDYLKAIKVALKYGVPETLEILLLWSNINLNINILKYCVYNETMFRYLQIRYPNTLKYNIDLLFLYACEEYAELSILNSIIQFGDISYVAYCEGLFYLAVNNYYIVFLELFEQRISWSFEYLLLKLASNDLLNGYFIFVLKNSISCDKQNLLKIAFENGCISNINTLLSLGATIQNDYHITDIKAIHRLKDAGFIKYDISNTIINTENIACLICYVVTNEIVKTSCGHVYCNECIEEWFKRSVSCPYCRKNLGFGVRT